MMLNMSNKYNSYQSITPTMLPSTTPLTKADRESIHSGQFMVSHFEAEEAQDDLLDDSEVKMLDPEDPNLSKPYEPNPCMELQLYVPRKKSLKQKDGGSSIELITSHLEIETSLTKLFKCMNLAYSQKLTSPKWNHFKGVRLRWKDKIRLNNVIWRCWHMQFILKRKTPVCQFASPLDVDIHSNPQSVVLEGKYWKRQLAVIKAEYRKWRRNSKSKATGCLTYDTKSEFDFLECSPLNDRSLMIYDDWTSDTLFAAINVPFPFPDSREIARGAGIADFIQPSLGSLQPNLDDIDPTFAELLQHTRLPPVPEEGSEEMLKNVDYSFSHIMSPEQMDSNVIMDVQLEEQVTEVQSSDDANMLDLNTPLDTMQYNDIAQQFTTRSLDLLNTQNVGVITAARSLNSNASETNSSRICSDEAMITDDRTNGLHQELTTSPPHGIRSQAKHYNNSIENILSRQNSNDFTGKSVIKGRVSKTFQRSFRREPHNYDKAQPTLHQTTIYQQMLAEQQKNQQQVQQQQQQQIRSQISSNNILQQQTNTFPQQQSHQIQYAATQFPQTTPNSIIRTGCDNNNGSNSYGYRVDHSNNIGSQANNQTNISLLTGMLDNSKGYNMLEATNNNASNIGMMNVKIEASNTNASDVLSLFSISSNNDATNSSVSNQHYSHFKKSVSAGAFINVREDIDNNAQTYVIDQISQSNVMHNQSLPMNIGNVQLGCISSSMHIQQGQQSQQGHAQSTQLSPTSSQQQQHSIQFQTNQTNFMPKEMFRSNSLPLNSSLQKLETRISNDNFVMPKYHIKNHSKSRARSNSIHQHSLESASSSALTSGECIITNNNNTNNNNIDGNLLLSQHLQTATSDPMLSTNALTNIYITNTQPHMMGKQQSSSTSAISIANKSMSTSSSSAPSVSASGIVSLSSTVNPSVNSTGIFVSPTPSSSSTSSLTISSVGTPTSPRTQKEIQIIQRQRTKMQKSPKKSNSLPTAARQLITNSPPSSKIISYPLQSNTHMNNLNQLSLSPESFHDQDSPLSPTHSLKYPRDNQRRAGHIHAEQKRRYNIKNAFDSLHSLIPQLQQNPNAKLSKAAMLQKGADHIKHLRSERSVLKDKMEMLQKERDSLNNSLMHLHSILPANGAPVTRQGTEHVRQLYEQYVRYRTMNNWKFWILGLILEPMLCSYTSSVSSASMEELRRTAFLWIDQHCSLVDLRPAVSNKLKYLSMKTDILSDPPSTLQHEIIKAVKNKFGQHPNLHGT